MALNRSVDVEITIDQITVEGFGAHNPLAFRLALERELARLVQERGVPTGWERGRSTPTLEIGSLRWDGRGAEAGLASALAGELYRELDR
jgi:hypothetical protein